MAKVSGEELASSESGPAFIVVQPSHGSILAGPQGVGALDRWGEVSTESATVAQSRAEGMAHLEQLAAGLTRPRVYAVDPATMLEVAAPPALAAVIPERIDFLVADLEPADQPLAITCFEEACRLGTAQVSVRFKGDQEPTLFSIVDLSSDIGVLAYIFSADAASVGPTPESPPVADADADASASVVITPGGKIVEVYGAIPGVLDDRTPELLGASLAAFIHPDDAAEALVAFAGALRDHRMGRRLRARLRTHDGAWRWLEATLFAGTPSTDGEVFVSCSLTDVEADVRARAALAESEDRFRMLAESIPIGVFGADGTGRIRYANETFRAITGLDNVGDWLALAHPDDRDEVAAAIERFGEGGEVLDVELRILPPGADDYRTTHVLARALRADDGTLVDVVGSMEDITDRKAMHLRLAHDASHDALTGLANRAHLVAELERRLAASFSGRDPLAVLFVDLDGFKRVNDSLGHTAGDQLLLTFARRLRDQARTGDLVSRFGGDEFVIVAEQTGGPDGALGMAHRVLEAISEPADVGGTQVRPRASIGVALAVDADADPETLLRDADAAMYEAKARGPNGVWLADAAVRGRADRRFGLEAALADALVADEYRLDYQPIVSLATGQILGAEGLFRWDSEQFGSPSPIEIVPLAEETGLIHALTDWTVGRAGRDLHTLRGAPDVAMRDSFQLGINLSCTQLSSPTFVDRYLGGLDALGLAAADLVVEVTETELVEESSVAEASLMALAAAGAQLAVDDFGAGYSSFDYLTRMPVTFLKIDRRLTRALPTNARARRVLRGLVSMCLDMGVAVVAEGIETADERDAYLEIGIEFGQGYLYAPALRIEALLAALRSGTPLRATT